MQLPDQIVAPSKAVIEDRWRGRAFEWSFLGLFALLLGLVTARHEMWEDELQAWLIARDSNSLLELFRNLHYEGHPGLWYLILYIPAHVSWNPVSMQVINYAIAVAEAWLILSARKLNWAIRILLIFSFFVFYQYGVVARNYMLAMLLLTAAVRCLVGERQHRILAAVLLALAINTHFFAFPIAAVFAFQFLFIKRLSNWSNVGKLFRERGFQAACVILFGGVLIAYFTIRLPADAYKHRGVEDHSVAYNLLSTESRTWQAFIPGNNLAARVPWLRLYWSPSNPRLFGPPAAFSLALFLLLAATLRTVQARFVFLITSLLQVIAMALVYRPALWHFGLIFVTFVLALLMDAYEVTERTSRPWLPRPVAFAVILGILVLQAKRTVTAASDDWSGPYSYSKEASSWLIQTGLDKNPLVVMPYTYGAPLLGYMQRSSAYYPACKCFGSFRIFKSAELNRVVTEEELENISRSSQLPVIVTSGWELPIETVQRLRMREIHAFSGAVTARETFYIYQRSSP